MLRTLLVFGILIPGIFAALANRFAGLLLYLWFALFRPMEFTWVDFSSLRLSLVVGALFVVPSLLTGTFPNVTHPLSFGAILFLLSALIAQLSAFNAAIGWYWIDFLARLLVVSLLSVTLINTRQRFIAVLAVIAASFGFHTAKAGLYALMHPGSRFMEGLAGAFIDNNGYALGMAMVLWLLIGTSQNVSRPWMKRALVAAAVLTSFATVATFSRGGFLALAASTLVFVSLQRRKTLALAGLALLLCALPFVPLPEGYTDRLQTIQTYDETNETSALSRLHFWRVAVNIAAANPTGVGLFNYESAYDRYDFLDGAFGRRRSVHSSYFQVLAETGFAGAILYCGLLAYSLVIVMRIRKRARSSSLAPDESRFLETSANALAASMVAFIAGGAFIALALNDLTWLTFALIASLDRLSIQMVAAPSPVSPTIARATVEAPRRFTPRRRPVPVSRVSQEA
jgi:putative inorganic carbon (hco3(-)) transporter